MAFIFLSTEYVYNQEKSLKIHHYEEYNLSKQHLRGHGIILHFCFW